MDSNLEGSVIIRRGKFAVVGIIMFDNFFQLVIITRR
jgi:hypothetical protein